MNRVDRLFAMVLLLQRGRLMTAQELAAHFQLSERTIYRDIHALTEVGIPVEGTPGEGYRLMEGFTLPPLALNPGEAKAVALAMRWFLRISTGRTHQHTTTSLAKIEAILPSTLRQEVQELGQMLDYYPHPFPFDWDDPRLRQIITAIQKHQVLRLQYRKYEAVASERRDIEPLHLTFAQGGWYVDAYCRLRQDIRGFRLSRIEALDVTDERFTPRMMLPARVKPITVRVRFQAVAQRQVAERQHYAFVGQDDEVSVYQVEQLAEIQEWLLGFGARAEVLEPPALRLWLKQEAQTLINLLT
jgi:predicted DNA-binding transcriptional regulator YafY